MKLVFEKGTPGRCCHLLPDCNVLVHEIGIGREGKLNLSEFSEDEVSRHYAGLTGRAHDVNDGFYSLGSCTMKYNPEINKEAASLGGFVGIHSLQPGHTVQGALRVFGLAERYLCEITGMEAMTFQPVAGAHGEFTDLLLMRVYHHFGGGKKGTKITVPDSAHDTNPTGAAVVGYSIVNIPSRKDGCVDLDKLKEIVREDTAGLMLIDPNTVRLFDKNILEITRTVRETEGLCYYDGTDLGAVMGIVRPEDMGFDVIHLSLHRTFSASHDGSSPGSGPVGYRELLRPSLSGFMVKTPGEKKGCGALGFVREPESTGRVEMFYGNFGVVVKALSYIMTLDREGILKASSNAVLSTNYMMNKLSDLYKMAYNEARMYEFIMTLKDLKHDINVSAMDIAEALLSYGICPPTMYFPLIVHKTLMVEPTETESGETLGQAIEVFRSVYEAVKAGPESLHQAPVKITVRRLDEVAVARRPVLRYIGE